MTSPRNIALLGSTGSIGQSTLEVVRHSAGSLRVVAMSAHSNCDQLCQQALEFKPKWVIATDPKAAGKCNWAALKGVSEVVSAADSLQRIVQSDDVDVVVAAIVGSAGLAGH